MAVIAAPVLLIPLDHLRGCPVAANPDDPDLAARVETYRMQRNGFRMNFDATRLTTPWITVAHCCECGAMNHLEEY